MNLPGNLRSHLVWWAISAVLVAAALAFALR